jgi:hypothetical protein
MHRTLLNTKQNEFGQYGGKEAKESCHGQFRNITSETVWKTWVMPVSVLADMYTYNIYSSVSLSSSFDVLYVT